MADSSLSRTAEKPKCVRCGSDHAVSYVGHWRKDWWTCAVCNVRWEDE